MMEHLIVYGTLQPGHENAHILDHLKGVWTKGYVKGFLHPEGWGYTQGYPALKIDPNGDDVPAHCLSSEKLHLHWDRLDQFEGIEYKRVLAEFHTQEGQVIEGYLYELNQ